MAKIFVSYSRQDAALVGGYVGLLQSMGHEVLMDTTAIRPGEDFNEALMQAQAAADGTLVFYTEHAAASRHVNSEIGRARSYYDDERYRKFLLLLTAPGIESPFNVQDVPRLELLETPSTDIIARIGKLIDEFMSRPRRSTGAGTAGTNDHYYSLDPDDSWAREQGYTLVGIVAYVPREAGNPVYQVFDEAASLHRLTGVLESADITVDRRLSESEATAAPPPDPPRPKAAPKKAAAKTAPSGSSRPPAARKK